MNNRHLANTVLRWTSRSTTWSSSSSTSSPAACQLSRVSRPPTARLATTPPVILHRQPSSIRRYSQTPKPSKIYTFEDIKVHSSNPASGRILIDTREPAELQATGTIPGSVNIPITSKPDAFHITAEDFQDKFGFERPSKDSELVFYCKAGVRSRAAAELAKQAGWCNVGEYPGSWLDWEKK